MFSDVCTQSLAFASGWGMRVRDGRDRPPPYNDGDGSLEGNATARRLAAGKYLLHLMRYPEARQRAIDRLGFDPVEKAAELMREKLGFDPDDYRGQDELANDA